MTFTYLQTHLLFYFAPSEDGKQEQNEVDYDRQESAESNVEDEGIVLWAPRGYSVHCTARPLGNKCREPTTKDIAKDFFIYGYDG